LCKTGEIVGEADGEGLVAIRIISAPSASWIPWSRAVWTPPWIPPSMITKLRVMVIIPNEIAFLITPDAPVLDAVIIRTSRQ